MTMHHPKRVRDVPQVQMVTQPAPLIKGPPVGCALCGSTENVGVSAGDEGTHCYLCAACEQKATVASRDVHVKMANLDGLFGR